MVAGAGAGVGGAMVIALGVIVAGLFGASPAQLPGLPGSERRAEPAPSQQKVRVDTGLDSRPSVTGVPTPTGTNTVVATTTPTGQPATTRRHAPTQTPSRPGKPQ